MNSSPSQIVAKYCTALKKNLSYHTELMSTVAGKRRQSIFESILVEQFVMSIAVQWESFLNDLILSYIHSDPEKFLEQLKDRVKQSVQDKFGLVVSKRTKFIAQKQASLNLINALIDPDGWNILRRA